MSQPIDKKKSVLGRGISALLDSNDTASTRPVVEPMGKQAGVVLNIPLEQIEVNPFQPRSTFEEDSLRELSESIAVHGVIQPVTVRRIENNKYQLIAGERRLRASKLAGKKEVPAYVRVASDQESIEIALIENIQREDLNPLEIGINYKRLMDECDLTQEELSARLGKNRSTVTNFLRLLKLPPDLQAGLRDNKISMGHAKALLGIEYLPTLLSLYKEVVAKELNVRQTEELVRSVESKPKKAGAAKKEPTVPYAIKKLEDKLSSSLGTKVAVHQTAEGKGEIILKFYSIDDLERITDLLAAAGK
jgi:ParB family chromosome partitioning protein